MSLHIAYYMKVFDKWSAGEAVLLYTIDSYKFLTSDVAFDTLTAQPRGLQFSLKSISSLALQNALPLPTLPLQLHHPLHRLPEPSLELLPPPLHPEPLLLHASPLVELLIVELLLDSLLPHERIEAVNGLGTGRRCVGAKGALDEDCATGDGLGANLGTTEGIHGVGVKVVDGLTLIEEAEDVGCAAAGLCGEGGRGGGAWGYASGIVGVWRCR